LLEPVPGATQAAPIDQAKLETITGGDAQFTAELLETFFASASQSVEEIERRFASDDRLQLARAVHRLKGAAANIHAVAVAQAALRLEQQCASATSATLTPMIAELKARIVQLAEYLQYSRPDKHVA